jgi:molybdate transport system substrate-binding protein
MRVFQGLAAAALALSLAVAPGASSQPATTARSQPVVTLLAASSTGPALEAIGERFAATGAGTLRLSLGASSALAQQIERGAPADAFLSASVEWMDRLDQKRLIDRRTRVDLLGNKLVLIAPAESRIDLGIGPGLPLAAALGTGRFAAALGASRLALADPDHVPAGKYAQAALEKLGAWPKLANRLARAEDVRAALAFVIRGEVAAGIVYASDVIGERRVRVVAEFPADAHPPIVYPLAIVAERARPEVLALAAYLRSPEARAIFARHGFILLTPSA